MKSLGYHDTSDLLNYEDRISNGSPPLFGSSTSPEEGDDEDEEEEEEEEDGGEEREDESNEVGSIKCHSVKLALTGQLRGKKGIVVYVPTIKVGVSNLKMTKQMEEGEISDENEG